MTLHQCAWCQLVIGGVGEQIYAKFAQENDVEDALIKSISVFGQCKAALE
jgi:hypothetical protein